VSAYDTGMTENNDKQQPGTPEERGLAHDALVYGGGAIAVGALGKLGANITDAVTDAISGKNDPPPPPPASEK
jgi:hypothetical protein